MRKKEDNWVYQYPSTTVKWKIVPTGANATPYIGDANKLLYQTKNMMTFNQLDSLRSVRFIFGDTGVIAKIITESKFGQDFIEIQVPFVAVPSISSCSITFLNVPESVPPMKWYAAGAETFTKVGNEWVIRKPNGDIEIEGIDYIKTYYLYSAIDCPDCSPLDFTICETDELTKDVEKCKPFIFEKAGIPSTIIDPNDHCIYTLSGCQAEIIKLEGGYFLWKAYTEWGSLETFSRSGLGYMLLRAFVNLSGQLLCATEDVIIKVDCCLKTDKKVEIWWKDWGTCQPFVVYAGGTLCKMPIQVPIGGLHGLSAYFSEYIKGALYAIPEVTGGCLPFEWTVNGPIELIDTEPMGTLTYATINEDYGCNNPITITLRDRCGEQYEVVGTPCCEDATAMEIDYTSLSMACGESQTLSASGGCPPYTWSLSGGGGTLTPNEGTALYTTPATNPNCTSNPTITLTDCCGKSEELKLAVNCYSGGEEAIRHADVTICLCQYLGYGCSGGTPYAASAIHWVETYHCDMTFHSTCYTQCGGKSCCGGMNVVCINSPDGDCRNIVELGNCYTGQCGGTTGTSCPGLEDRRTGDMITQGCCPLNPITGLPY